MTPAEGAVLNNPSRIVFVAKVANGGGQVSKVEFFSGSKWLGTAAPFTESELDDDGAEESSDATLYLLSWNRPTIGSHTVTAVVTYRAPLGATATSAPAHITVKRTPFLPRYKSSRSDD